MDRQTLLARYRATRALSLELCRPLKAEDFRIQSMPDVSPPWWNLGHTSWFFAKNVLEPFGRYRAADARLEYALNSYYESLGPRLARDHRGLVTRPTTDEVFHFRSSVDERLESLLREAPEDDLPRLRFLVFTGIQHEQQHQELLVTEIKHILGANVPELREPYLAGAASPGAPPSAPDPLRFVPFASGLHEFGNLEGGWCWDNEMPVHRAWLDTYALADRLVTNAEYLEFVDAGGYSDPLLWLSNGWARARDAGWSAPLYWERDAAGGRWRQWTLAGLRELDLDEPVAHVSFYEAANGPAPACPRSVNGSTPRGHPDSRGKPPTSSIPGSFTRAPPTVTGSAGRAPAHRWPRWAAISGSGPRTTTSPTPATSPSTAP